MPITIEELEQALEEIATAIDSSSIQNLNGLNYYVNYDYLEPEDPEPSPAEERTN